MDIGNLAIMNDPDEFIPTRHSLLSRLKDWGDQKSWKVFFDTYWKFIYNAAIRAGLSDAEAQDVVQETVIAVSKKIPAFVYDPLKGSFKTWLMRQTRWRIKGQLRKRMPIENSEAGPTAAPFDIEGIPDPTVSALETLWEEEWQRNLLEAAMDRVKNRVDVQQYQVFDLCVRQKWSVSRAAKSLKITVARVYMAKHRIGNLIKKEIEQMKKKPI